MSRQYSVRIVAARPTSLVRYGACRVVTACSRCGRESESKTMATTLAKMMLRWWSEERGGCSAPCACDAEPRTAPFRRLVRDVCPKCHAEQKPGEEVNADGTCFPNCLW